MAKEILQGSEARLKIKKGVDRAADAVRPTLGPIGMTALIEYPGLDPIECDDGVTILKSLEFEDAHENMGLQTLRTAALRTSTEGGDGTATTTVLTQAFVDAAFKEVGDDSSKIREVKERLHAGLAATIEDLKTFKRDITEADVERIATISSLDADVAKLIAQAIHEVGVNGVITVERGAQLGYSCEVVKGARFDKGLISPFFVNDKKNLQTILEDAYVVLVDRKISSNEQIMPMLQSIGSGKSILFIATDVDGMALASLAHNAQNNVANIAAVRNPYSASAARDFLFDVAALTGARVISEEMGVMLEKADVEFCGRAEKIIVTRDTTTIIGGNVGTDLESRILSIQAQINNTTSEYQRGMLEDRLAALTGGIGVIRIGAYTDTEFNAKKLKFDNAINATQAALQEGILPGGGMALLAASMRTREPMFEKALSAPFRQMAENAGMHPDIAFMKIQSQPFTGCINFITKQTADTFEDGIIDPFKVTRLALESAVAIAASLVGIETVITTVKENGKTDK